jgi:Domain of unknown function (DUF4833)
MISTPNRFLEVLHLDDSGRPTHYPEIDNYDSLLFYIQRNQNLNAVIYEVNHDHAGLINLNQPINIHWLKYDADQQVVQQELNYMQKKLAYGYHHEVISNELLVFRFVSYDKMKFYIAKNNVGRYRVFFSWQGQNVELISIYIHAEDMGVFPQVKFAEFFGKSSVDNSPFYKRLKLG